MTTGELRPFENKIVTLTLTDGEVMKARLYFVDEEYQDVIVDVLETTTPERYQARETSAFCVCVADIVSAAEYG